jgi:hypothetical protein
MLNKINDHMGYKKACNKHFQNNIKQCNDCKRPLNQIRKNGLMVKPFFLRFVRVQVSLPAKTVIIFYFILMVLVQKSRPVCKWACIQVGEFIPNLQPGLEKKKKKKRSGSGLAPYGSKTGFSHFPSNFRTETQF